MSFKPNQNQQITLNDSFINQTPRTQKIIIIPGAGILQILFFRLSMKNGFLFFIATISNFIENHLP